MKMKKLAALALSAVFALGALTACGGSSSSGSVPAAASASGSGSVSGASLKEVNIGLIQLMEHASLDEIRTAIEAGLEAKGAEYGVKVNVDYQNAQGDTSTINTICQQFVGNKVDAIVAIATPAAQGAATAVAGTDIPVIFRETSRVPPTRSPLKKSSSLPPSLRPTPRASASSTTPAR